MVQAQNKILLVEDNEDNRIGTKHIPVIAVTAHALPGDEERSLEAGCDGYLAKPISPAHLIAEVDRRFGRTTPSYVPVRLGESASFPPA